MLCDHLEGWDRKDGRGDARGRGYGDICICIADSLCYKAETKKKKKAKRYFLLFRQAKLVHAIRGEEGGDGDGEGVQRGILGFWSFFFKYIHYVKSVLV